MVPEVFKYGSLLSLPLFSIVALFLVKNLPDFSFSQHTVSKSVQFLNDPARRLVFRLNFIPKAFLDLGFVLYVLQRFSIPVTSFIAWDLILAASLFALLAYFIEGKYRVIHGVIIYSIGVLWAIGLIYLAFYLQTRWFMVFTVITAGLPACLAFLFLGLRKTNVWVQALCMSILYSWFVVFTYTFL